MKKWILTLFLVLIFGSGCSLFETEYDGGKTVEELVAEASSAYVAGEYETAIKAYNDLKDWYPFSKYAILAELKIADAHYALKEYPEAIVAYEEFERMHPRNEAIPYVIFQTAMSWFKQIETIDRDDTPAKKAMVQFQRLQERFPADEHAQEADKKIKLCLQNISGHEFYVAEYYLKQDLYKAALKRYEYIVANYPDSKESVLAKKKIIQCRSLIKNE